MALIIVEGSNRVGKSSIINKLCKMHNVSKIYNRHILTGMKDKQQESYISAMAMLDVIEQTSVNQNIILDRFHISEYIYGNYHRNYCNTKMYTEVDVRLEKMDAMLITVTSNFTHLYDTIGAKKLEEYKYLQDAFIEGHKTSKIKDKMLIRLEDIT